MCLSIQSIIDQNKPKMVNAPEGLNQVHFEGVEISLFAKMRNYF